MQGPAAAGTLGFKGKQKVCRRSYFFSFAHLIQCRLQLGLAREVGKNTFFFFFLINELADDAIIQAHFVLFLTRSLQDTPGKTKAASSDTALPCPLG